MDEQEREYLVNCIRSLERSKRRWQVTAAIAVVSLMLAILIMAGANVIGGGFMFQQARMRAAEEEARSAMMQALEAKAQADMAEARLRDELKAKNETSAHSPSEQDHSKK
jgi:hypothetical protein